MSEPQRSDSRLVVVKAYLDLISRDDHLVAGSGLNKLYTLSMGYDGFNETQIAETTDRAEQMGLIPASQYNFMQISIIKNCMLYGELLTHMIQQRILGIANGDVDNSFECLDGNTVGGKVAYYAPPVALIKRCVLALKQGLRESGPVLVDVATDAEFYLTQLSGSTGQPPVGSTSWRNLTNVVMDLRALLRYEDTDANPAKDYRTSARPALKLLWVLTKLLYGDLVLRPSRQQWSDVDLFDTLHLSDGTLAALPFPIAQSVYLFTDHDTQGVGLSIRAKAYLSAVNTAALDRSYITDEG